MGLSKDFAKLPGAWSELFFWLQDHPSEVRTIVCESEQKAKALRLDYYRAVKVTATAMGPTYMLESLGNLEKRMLLVRGNNLIFSLNDKHTTAQVIQSAVNQWKEEGD